MSTAGVFGYPVVDVQVTCFDGKYHPVDSSEMSFKMAGSLGFKEAMAKAGPVLLEPVSLLEVTVPAAFQGDVLGDLNSRRGRVQGTETGDDGEQVVVAMVPTSEILRYAIDLRSLTGGRGRFSVAARPLRPVAPTSGTRYGETRPRSEGRLGGRPDPRFFVPDKRGRDPRRESGIRTALTRHPSHPAPAPPPPLPTNRQQDDTFSPPGPPGTSPAPSTAADKPTAGRHFLATRAVGTSPTARHCRKTTSARHALPTGQGRDTKGREGKDVPSPERRPGRPPPPPAPPAPHLTCPGWTSLRECQPPTLSPRPFYDVGNRAL